MKGLKIWEMHVKDKLVHQAVFNYTLSLGLSAATGFFVVLTGLLVITGPLGHCREKVVLYRAAQWRPV